MTFKWLKFIQRFFRILKAANNTGDIGTMVPTFKFYDSTATWFALSESVSYLIPTPPSGRDVVFPTTLYYEVHIKDIK